MKTLLTALLICLGTTLGLAQSTYDAELAQKLGADDYGMKTYVMAFLKRGPNQSLSKAEAQKIQQGHLENILRMADEGTLLMAGPFLDTGAVRGIYIFNVASLEEAQKLTESDPAIQAGTLVMELKKWYGPAALQEVYAISKKTTKKSISGK